MGAEGKVGGPGRLRRPVLVAVVMAALIAAALAAILWTGAARSECVSVGMDGAPGNGQSRLPTISADGRYVAFHSDATDLVPGDTNRCTDVFVFDRATGVTRRVSLALDGSELQSDSPGAAISPDGRFVAFWAREMPLPPDGRVVSGVFLHDLVTGVVQCVAATRDGAAPGSVWDGDLAVSVHASIVAFATSASGIVAGGESDKSNVYVFDRAKGRVELVSVSTDGRAANAISFWPTVSADGRYVAFESWASNLVAGTQKGTSQVYVRDRLAATTVLASCDAAGPLSGYSATPSMSADGSMVAFRFCSPGEQSHILVRDMQKNVLRPVPFDRTRSDTVPAISGDGRCVTFWHTWREDGDYADLYRYALDTGAIERLLSGSGPRVQFDRLPLSFDGRCVAFVYSRMHRYRSPRILCRKWEYPWEERQICVIGPRPQADAPAH
jgi:Tol biopolymer transport system component